MATYIVDAKELEGVIFHFRAHHKALVLAIHPTFNVVYGVDLYETDFHFLFNDVPKNRLTVLYKNASKRLLGHMITHVKTKSGSIGARSKTDKVDKLLKII